MKRSSLALLFLLANAAAAADLPPGIQYETQTLQETGTTLHIVHLDLTQKELKIRTVPAGENPGQNSGVWQTTLQTVPTVAARENFLISINGDYFGVEPAKVDANSADGLAALASKGTYRPGARAVLIGTCVTDGRPWALAREARPTLLVREDGAAQIEEVRGAVPAGVQQAVSGNLALVWRGRVANHKAGERNARTGIGLNQDRTRLTLVVADGLAGGRASGLTVPEFAREMQRLGCHDAINLDGGGSSTMVIREGEGTFRVVNHPTDGKARAVANVVGVGMEGRK